MSRAVPMICGLSIVLCAFAIQGGCFPKVPLPRNATRAVTPVRSRPEPTPQLEASCELLYDQYKRCKETLLSQQGFIKLCDKMQSRPQIDEEIECSVQTNCNGFRRCIKRAKKERLLQRWWKTVLKTKQGKYASAIRFCELWAKELTDELRAKCRALPARAAAHLLKVITARRDAGRVSYEENAVPCRRFKRYAKAAGPKWHQKADILCREVKLAQTLLAVREVVAWQLKRASPMLPAQCAETELARYRKIGTAWATRRIGKLIALCYRKLGRYILSAKLPRQKRKCLVTDVFQGIKRYRIRGRVINRLMRRAARKCR